MRSICNAYDVLAADIDDEELSNKLHDLAGECIAEFFMGVIAGK